MQYVGLFIQTGMCFVVTWHDFFFTARLLRIQALRCCSCLALSRASTSLQARGNLNCGNTFGTGLTKAAAALHLFFASSIGLGTRRSLEI